MPGIWSSRTSSRSFSLGPSGLPRRKIQQAALTAFVCVCVVVCARVCGPASCCRQLSLAAEPLSFFGILGFAFLSFMLAMVAFGTTFMACVHILMVLRGTSTLQVLRHMVRGALGGGLSCARLISRAVRLATVPGQDATDDREGIVTQLCFGKAKPGLGVPTSLWERIKRVFGSNILLVRDLKTQGDAGGAHFARGAQMPFPILSARDRARAFQIGLGPLQLKSATTPVVLA